MSQKPSSSFFRRIFTCPSNPEIATISDQSDEAQAMPFPGKSRLKTKKNRRQKDERFRSATNISQNRDLVGAASSDRFSASENRLTASNNRLTASNNRFSASENQLAGQTNQIRVETFTKLHFLI